MVENAPFTRKQMSIGKSIYTRNTPFVKGPMSANLLSMSPMHENAIKDQGFEGKGVFFFKEINDKQVEMMSKVHDHSLYFNKSARWVFLLLSFRIV